MLDMVTMQETIINAKPLYYTWTSFKRDLELNVGHYVSNNLWIQAKPKKPLPWTNADLKNTAMYVIRAAVEFID